MVLDIGLQSLLDPPLDIPGYLNPVVEVQRLDIGPNLGRYRPTQLGNQGQLMLVRVSLHDGGPGPHLGHDAPGPPHVHGRPVVPLPQQQLGGAVPQGHHPVGVSVGLTGFVDRDGSG